MMTHRDSISGLPCVILKRKPKGARRCVIIRFADGSEQLQFKSKLKELA